MSRLVSNVSGNLNIFQSENKEKLIDTLGKIVKSPLIINETAFLVDSIEKTCDKQNGKTPLDLVIIDYFQLIRSKKMRTDH